MLDQLDGKSGHKDILSLLLNLLDLWHQQCITIHWVRLFESKSELGSILVLHDMAFIARCIQSRYHPISKPIRSMNVHYLPRVTPHYAYTNL